SESDVLLAFGTSWDGGIQPIMLSYFDLKSPRADAGAEPVVWLGLPLPGQGADLDQVVGEYSVPAPDGGSVHAVQPCAVPSVGVLEVADPAFGSSASLDEAEEPAVVLECFAGW